MIEKFISSLPVIVDAIGCALIHFIWQGALIAAITAVVMLMLRNASPQTRYSVACFALLMCVLLPIRELIFHMQADLPVMQQTSISFVVPKVVAGENSLQEMGSWLQINLRWIVLWWAIAVSLLSIRLAIGLLWLRGYYDGTRGVQNVLWQEKLNILVEQFGVHRAVLLRVVHDIESPITLGLMRPLVLIPASLLTGMPTNLLEALIAHEVAHISRFDYLMNLIQNIIEMLLFFHPAVWWISKKIRSERENIADDLAARILGEPRRLALALQELDKFQFTTPQLAQAAHGGNLMSRIKRLIRPEVQSINWKTAVTAVGITAVCLSLLAHAAVPVVAPIIGMGASNSAIESVFDRETLQTPVIMEKQIALPRKKEKLRQDKAKQSNVVDEGKTQNSRVFGEGEKKNIDIEDNIRKQKDVIVPARIDFAVPGCNPEYPRSARRYEHSGMTSLVVSVSDQGEVNGVEVTESSKFESLDNAVRNQLLSGKCKGAVTPGTINGVPQPTITRVQYLWKIE